MGVNYQAILAIGKEFENAQEAFEFLDSHGLMDEEAVQMYEEDYYLADILPCNMDGRTIDVYSGYGYYIGYRIRCHSPETFEADFYEGMKNWQEAFSGKVEPEMIHTVVIS